MTVKDKIPLIVVSFGTSYENTRRKTIDKIEEDLGAAFPELDVRRAWTSGVIMRKLLERDDVKINNVEEAMEEIVAQGYSQVVVQPTHIINGAEYEKMLMQLSKFQGRISFLGVGLPLLSLSDDYESVCHAVMSNIKPLEKGEVLLLMGHGSGHHADAAYAALDYRFKNLGYDDVFVGTVEGFPELEEVLPAIRKRKPDKIRLLPLMIVAGDHAINDMAGEGKDSWASILNREGYEVESVIKGLGEFSQIRDIYIRHLSQVMERKSGCGCDCGCNC